MWDESLGQGICLPVCSEMLPSQKWRELELASFFLLLGLNFLYAANTQNVRHYETGQPSGTLSLDRT